jgi:hypothetical protein
MSGLAFDHFAEAIRSCLQRLDQALMREVFGPCDEGGMSFVSVESLDAESFNRFAAAASDAFAAEQQANRGSVYWDIWRELLRVLEEDPRRTE